nr:hypothetical protein [Acetivibrio ethanolgignens]
MSKVTGNEAAYGRWWCSPYRNNSCSTSIWSFLRKSMAGSCGHEAQE